MTDLINESVNYRGNCRTAPATPGKLISDLAEPGAVVQTLS